MRLDSLGGSDGARASLFFLPLALSLRQRVELARAQSAPAYIKSPRKRESERGGFRGRDWECFDGDRGGGFQRFFSCRFRDGRGWRDVEINWVVRVSRNEGKEGLRLTDRCRIIIGSTLHISPQGTSHQGLINLATRASNWNPEKTYIFWTSSWNLQTP